MVPCASKSMYRSTERSFPVSPEELEKRFEEAFGGPAVGRRPREVGHPPKNYRRTDHIAAVKIHLSCMDPDDWKQMAHDIRRGKVLRLCNDEVLIALLRLWMGGKP